ncbi:MAG: VWA domain-containing protein [Kofleriaceae bacterium]
MFGAELSNPWLLLAALLAIPALWWSRRSSGRVVFSSLRALPDGGNTWRTRLAWLPDALTALAVIGLAVALAGPRKGDRNSRVRREGIAIMMAVDVSGSMRALDLSRDDRELTRLDAVKQVFERFVLGGKDSQGRDDDAVGLVAFARYAETRSPLTLDHNNLATAARQLDFAPSEEDGTAIGAGLELAVQRLIEFKPDQKVGKVVILLTDGESNVHEIDEDTAIDDATKAGIKVYTIGAGTRGKAPVRVEMPGGRSVIRVVEVSIDEATLQRIASRTGGQYFRATDNASLAKIYGEIDRLERTEIEQEQFTEYRQYYAWFVVGAMAVLTLALVLRGTLLRRLP